MFETREIATILLTALKNNNNNKNRWRAFGKIKFKFGMKIDMFVLYILDTSQIDLDLN